MTLLKDLIRLFCAILVAVSFLVGIVAPQPAQKRKTQRSLRIYLPDGASDAQAANNENVPGYELNGRFVPDGELSFKHGNGRNAVTGAYLDGRPNGAWRTFYPNGKLESEAIYINGEPNGIARRFWPNGKIARKDTFEKGDKTSSILYSKSGRIEKSHKKKNKKVVYAIYQTSKGRLIADAIKNSLRFKDEEVGKMKVCQLYDNGAFRCKSQFQIWRDLNTFMDPEQVLEVLEDVNLKADQAGIGDAKQVLSECGGNWVATSASNLGRVVEPSSNFRVQITSSELSGIKSACRDAQLNSLGFGNGGGNLGANRDYQQQIDQTKEGMEGIVSSCESNRQFSNRDMIGLGWTEVAAIAGIVGVAISAASVAIQYQQLTHDGYTPWQRDTTPIDGFSGKTESRQAQNLGDRSKRETKGFDAAGNPVFQEEEDDGKGNKTTVITTKTGWNDYNVKTYRNGVLIRDVTVNNGSRGDTETIVIDYEKGTRTVYNCYRTQSCTQRTEPLPNPNPAPSPVVSPVPTPGATPNPAPGASPTPSPGSSPNPSPSPSAGIPCDECRAGNCEAMASWWARTSAMCDKNGWQTYECSSIIRKLNGCVDSALILPGPDGDLTCQPRQEWTSEDTQTALCKRSKMFEGNMLGAETDCTPARLDGDQLRPNICNDPRAQCLPDQRISDGLILSRNRVLTPEPRLTPQP
ncbi:MAG: hypothetical protein R2684_14100 [Pyrinomonadaceae bacterium]